jgi:hypothetical protein
MNYYDDHQKIIIDFTTHTTITCWYMGPVSLVAYHQHKVILPLLLQWLAQERNWVWTHRSVSRCAVDYVGGPFCEHWLCPSLLTASQKIDIRGSREIRMIDGHMRTEHGKHVACWSGFPL